MTPGDFFGKAKRYAGTDKPAAGHEVPYAGNENLCLQEIDAATAGAVSGAHSFAIIVIDL